jgi:hypothetical protein
VRRIVAAGVAPPDQSPEAFGAAIAEQLRAAGADDMLAAARAAAPTRPADGS